MQATTDTPTVAQYPPRNSKLIAIGVDRAEADRLAEENRPAVVHVAYEGGYEVWALGR